MNTSDDSKSSIDFDSVLESMIAQNALARSQRANYDKTDGHRRGILEYAADLRAAMIQSGLLPGKVPLPASAGADDV